jgi:hypothetical protein
MFWYMLRLLGILVLLTTPVYVFVLFRALLSLPIRFHMHESCISTTSLFFIHVVATITTPHTSARFCSS